MSSLALPPMRPIPTTSGGTPTPSPHPASSQQQPSNPALQQQQQRSRKRSSPLLEEESDEEEEEEKRRGGGNKKKGGNNQAGLGWDDVGDYKYLMEIRQMMFVFGEVQMPLPETVKLVEDIVRGQIIEIVTRARLLTHLRSNRFLSPEDLIFLIRDDRGKVNRLRTYLSWKDVRKKAKDESEKGGEDIDLDVDEDKALKGRKQMVKLPWELLTPFSGFLRGLPNKRVDGEEDDEDDDELQAHEDSMQRLREADEITKKMTKNEYAQYSECRQASFTYRRGRRFREFINFGAYLDVRPNDDIVDILGFLAFEMVRSLCVTALDLRERLEKTKPTSTGPAGGAAGGAATTGTGGVEMQRRNTGGGAGASPTKRPRLSPEAEDPKPAPPTNANPTSLFAPPPSARQPLQPCHILEAFAQIQRTQAANRVGGMGNFKAGAGKRRMALV
ncbi:hypothetical protein IAT38_007335 [Cryptococcus sp. DSM 104549]